MVSEVDLLFFIVIFYSVCIDVNQESVAINNDEIVGSTWDMVGEEIDEEEVALFSFFFICCQ